VNLAFARASQARAGDQSSGGTGAALEAARRGVETDPNRPTVHFALAQIADALGDPALALDEVTAALRLYKGDPGYDRVAADAALRLPDRSSARAKLEEILSLKESAPLRTAAAKLALASGDREVARMNATRALQLDSTDADARTILAQLGEAQ
jgi:tetratricopeptide (TPR) repeat protein